MGEYEVIVGNIGGVYRGADEDKAKQEYKEYVSQSVDGYGRAGGEDVTLLRDGEIVMEHTGNPDEDSKGAKENPRRGPGKFSSDLDAILYSLSLDGTDEDFSEEGFGSYSLLVDVTREDLERAAKDAGEELTEEDIEEGEGASAILFERTDGIVEVDLYDSEKDAREEWAKIEKAYEEFMEEVGE